MIRVMDSRRKFQGTGCFLKFAPCSLKFTVFLDLETYSGKEHCAPFCFIARSLTSTREKLLTAREKILELEVAARAQGDEVADLRRRFGATEALTQKLQSEVAGLRTGSRATDEQVEDTHGLHHSGEESNPGSLFDQKEEEHASSAACSFSRVLKGHAGEGASSATKKQKQARSNDTVVRSLNLK